MRRYRRYLFSGTNGTTTTINLLAIINGIAARILIHKEPVHKAVSTRFSTPESYCRTVGTFVLRSICFHLWSSTKWQPLASNTIWGPSQPRSLATGGRTGEGSRWWRCRPRCLRNGGMAGVLNRVFRSACRVADSSGALLVHCCAGHCKRMATRPEYMVMPPSMLILLSV